MALLQMDRMEQGLQAKLIAQGPTIPGQGQHESDPHPGKEPCASPWGCSLAGSGHLSWGKVLGEEGAGRMWGGALLCPTAGACSYLHVGGSWSRGLGAGAGLCQGFCAIKSSRRHELFFSGPGPVSPGFPVPVWGLLRVGGWWAVTPQQQEGPVLTQTRCP